MTLKYLRLVLSIKLIIHFGEDKTKSIFFASQGNIKNIKKTLKYKDIQIKQRSQVIYLSCVME